MLNISISRKVAVLFICSVFFISCDKDFNEIGANIVGDNNFGVAPDVTSTVEAFSQKTGVVETTNLPVNPLGVLDNGAFGKTTAHFVTQLELVSEGPEFTNVPVERVKSVILKIPYYSTFVETNSEGASTYTLDSIYGNIANKINLSIYENGYYMRDFDPNDEFQAQKYYSDQYATFDNAKRGADGNGNSIANGTRLNNADTSQNTEFMFSPAEIVIQGEDDEDDVREAPAMRLELNKAFFHKKLIETDDANLANNNVFKNYFRGLYFKVEEISGSALAMLDFSRGTITMTYDDDPTSTDATEPVEKTLVLNLKGNTVSLLEHTATAESQDYENNVGVEKLYLKGGNGSVAFIDLFGGENSAELETLRQTAISNNWIINEANLVFHVDQDAMSNTIDPHRIYLYDAKNHRPLVDYYYDTSTYPAKPKFAKVVHGGIAQLSGVSGDTDRKAVKYKFRITEHVKNVIYKDSTNVRLGLSVTENIARIDNRALKVTTPQFSRIPLSSVMNQLGTILYNSEATNPEKKLRLEIYYTKPN